MSKHYSNEVREEIIKKSLLIFNMAFTEDTISELEKEQLEKSVCPEQLNQEKTPDETYKVYAEELLSQGKLEGFIKKLGGDHQSNQTLQNAVEELIDLLEDLDIAKSEQRNLEPPFVPVKYTTEDVHDASQRDRASSYNSHDREIPNDDNETNSQFTFNRCLEALKQFTHTLLNGTEQPRLTAKQFIGFIVMVLGAMLVAIGFGVDKKG